MTNDAVEVFDWGNAIWPKWFHILLLNVVVIIYHKSFRILESFLELLLLMYV